VVDSWLPDVAASHASTLLTLASEWIHCSVQGIVKVDQMKENIKY
jgi:hypothetical protein